VVWGVVYGIGIFALEPIVNLKKQSPITMIWWLGWPIAVSTGLFILGSTVYDTKRKGLRAFCIGVMTVSCFAVIDLDSALRPPLVSLPTFARIYFALL